MKNDRLLNAFGEIDERYILEAAPKAERVEIQKKDRKTNKRNRFFRRSAIAAALVLCVSLSGVTALASTGALQGFFKDTFGWKGAVVGTAYEQANDEIKLSVVEVTDQLVVVLEMAEPDKVPYSEFEMFGIEHYKIVDRNNKVIASETAAQMEEVTDGKVSVAISLDQLPSGNYKLTVSEMVGSKKADQPLILSGSWECVFTKQ